MNVSFIGLGVMGSRMANNLLENGVELTIYNRTEEKAKPLIEKGAHFQPNHELAVKDADVVFTMLANPEAVDLLATGEEGFVAFMKQNALWVDCSTVNPSFTKKMHQLAHNRGVRFMDAPVAGTKGPAENGELVFLVGGESNDLEQVEHLLEFMGKKIIHTGEVGNGTSFKMLVNSMLATNMAAFAEALMLGEKLGLSRDFLLETLPNMPVSAPFLKAKANKIADDNYEEEFALKHMQKDMHLATLSGYEKDTALKLMNLVKEMYAEAKVNGFSDNDFSAIYKFNEQLHK